MQNLPNSQTLYFTRATMSRILQVQMFRILQAQMSTFTEMSTSYISGPDIPTLFELLSQSCPAHDSYPTYKLLYPGQLH